MGKIIIEVNSEKYEAIIPDELAQEIIDGIIKLMKKEYEPDIIYKVPSGTEVYDFIKTLPEYRHCIKDIIDEFIGEPLSSTNKRRVRGLLGGKIIRARNQILKDEKGHWEFQRRGLNKEFYFVCI